MASALKLSISRRAGRFIRTLPPKQYKQVVGAILSLPNDPRPHDSRMLKAGKNLRRVDIGEYRVVYRVEDDSLLVLVAGKRNDDAVYRMLSRL